MDKRFIKEITNYYQNQRLLSFYKKREKSVIIPHLLFYFDRALSQKKKKKDKLKILDVGCGAGNLLEIIETILKVRHPREKLFLYGLDQDKDLIRRAKKRKPENSYYLKDLQLDNLSDIEEKFDIITVVNTLHEVFSSKILLENGKRNEFNTIKMNQAKEVVFRVIKNVSRLLKKEGVLLIFGGIEAEGFLEKKIRFKIKNKVLQQYLKKFIKEFSPWKLKIKKIRANIYEANKRDFTRFITTFKFLNSKLWPIESRESYQFFTKGDFLEAIKTSGLLVESINVISNDIGLYENNVEILTPKEDFPPQSILIAGSRKYIVTKFDYFCSDQNSFENS